MPTDPWYATRTTDRSLHGPRKCRHASNLSNQSSFTSCLSYRINWYGGVVSQDGFRPAPYLDNWNLGKFPVFCRFLMFFTRKWVGVWGMGWKDGIRPYQMIRWLARVIFIAGSAGVGIRRKKSSQVQQSLFQCSTCSRILKFTNASKCGKCWGREVFASAWFIRKWQSVEL